MHSADSENILAPTPIVSVALAVFNAERYLAEAIESILNQTLADFELIIIDDGSTDGSLKILRHYAERDSRIRLLSRENRGIAKTRNEINQLACGEFIAVMDADDVAMPDRLSKQVEFLHSHPSVVCVGGAYDWIDEAGRLLMTQVEPLEDSEIQAWMLQGRTCINHPSAMIRRSALMQAGGYDENFQVTVGDLDLFLRLGEVGELANLPDTVLRYRQHSHSVSEVRQLQQIEDKREACQRAWPRRGIQGKFTETRPWRPVDKPSLHQHLLKYGWQFFMTRQRWAAIAYGIKAIRTLPLEMAGWKLLVVALIKPFPKAGAYE